MSPGLPSQGEDSCGARASLDRFLYWPLNRWTFGSSEGDYTGVIVVPPMVFYPFDLKPSGAALGGQLGYNF